MSLAWFTPVLAQDVVRVAFNELPPWKVIEPDGTPGGIDMAFLRLVAERMHLTLEVDKVPFVRAMRMLKAGGADLMTGLLRRPDREEFLAFVDPPYRLYSNKAFFLRKGEGRRIQKYEDLYGMTIGVVRGVRYFPTFDHDPRIRRDEVSDALLNYNKLLHNRFDALIATEETAEYRIRQMGLEDQVEKAPFVYRQPQSVYIGVSLRSPLAARLEELGRVVRQLLDEGEYERIQREYLER